MPYPWANVILLLLLAAELGTGIFGLVSGSADRAIYLQLHRIFGFSILAVFLWKGRNIFTSLARIIRRRSRPAKTPATPFPYGSLAILLLLALCIGLALAWSHTGPFHIQGFSGVSWHIYASIPLAPLLLWHAISHRWTLRPSVLGPETQLPSYGRVGPGWACFVADGRVRRLDPHASWQPEAVYRLLRRRQLFRQCFSLNFMD